MESMDIDDDDDIPTQINEKVRPPKRKHEEIEDDNTEGFREESQGFEEIHNNWNEMIDLVNDLFEDCDETSLSQILSLLDLLSNGEISSRIYFPMNEDDGSEEYKTLEECCYNFNSWLLGQLLYLSTVNGVTEDIKKATCTLQLNILKEIDSHSSNLVIRIMNNYHLCLGELVNILENETRCTDKTLSKFVVNHDVWGGDELIQHPVIISSHSTCCQVIDYLLQVLGPAVLILKSGSYSKLHAELLEFVNKILNICLPIEIIMRTLDVVVNIFQVINPGYISAFVLSNFVSSLRMIVESYWKTVDKDKTEALGGRVADVLTAFVKIENSDIVRKKLLLDMCTRILENGLDDSFPVKLLDCSSLVVCTLLEKNEKLCIGSTFIDCLIDNVLSCNSGIHVIMHQVKKESLDFYKVFGEMLSCSYAKMSDSCSVIEERLLQLNSETSTGDPAFKTKVDDLRKTISKIHVDLNDNHVNLLTSGSYNYSVVNERSRKIISKSLQLEEELASFLEDVVQNYPLLAGSVVDMQDEIGSHIPKLKEMSAMLENKSVPGTLVSKTWMNVWNMFTSSVDSMLLELPGGNINHVIKVLRFLLSIIQCSAAISVEIENTKSSSEANKIWYSTAFLDGKVNSIMELVVEILNRSEKQEVRMMAIKIVVNLIKIPDFHKASREVLNTSILLLSLPWINKKPDFWDLEASFLSTVDLESWIKDNNLTSCTTELKMLCIEQLVYYPADIALFWRTSIVYQCLKDDSIAFRVLLVKLLPGLFVMKSPDMEKVALEIIEMVDICKKEEVYLAMSEELGHIICSLSGSCVTKRKLDADWQVMIYVSCPICEVTGKRSNTSPDNFSPDVTTAVTKCALALLSSNVTIRCNMIRFLPHITAHLHPNHNILNWELWMPALRDNNSEVRLALSKTFSSYLFREFEDMFSLSTLQTVSLYLLRLNDDTNEEIFASCYQYLLDSLFISMEEKNVDNQKTLEETAFQIGCVNAEAALMSSLSLLMVFILHPYSLVKSSATKHLKDLASLHNTTLPLMFSKYKDELANVITIVMLGSTDVSNVFTAVTSTLIEAFEARNTDKFTDSLINVLLPHVVMSALESSVAREVIKQMAAESSSMDGTIKTLLENNFQYIYTHLILKGDDDIKKYTTYLEEAMGSDISSLKSKYYKIVCSELLLNLSVNQQKVEKALKDISSVVYPGQRNSQQQLAQMLDPLLLATLVSISDYLMSLNVSDCKKCKALLSLNSMMDLVGPKHITPLRFKILKTLCFSLHHPSIEFQKLSCKSWNTFVHNVQLDVLGPLLSTIFVSLLQILETFPGEVEQIFQFLVDFEILHPYLKHLYFVPNHVAIRNVYIMIQNFTNQNRPLFEVFQDVLKDIKHENVQIQVEGLKYLKKLISENYVTLHASIMKSDEQISLITEMIETLISTSGTSCVAVSRLCAECIGEIGAIDAGILSQKQPSASRNKVSCATIRSESFVEIALTEIVRAFQNSRSHSNTFSYIIQETLKDFKVAPNAKSTRRHLWDKLPENIQNIVMPFVKSQYVVKNRPHSLVYPHPIYGSKYGKHFTYWVTHLTMKLIPLVNDEFVESFFKLLSLGMMLNNQMLLFFFPYIVLHVLLTGEKSTKNLLLEELLTPLRTPPVLEEPADETDVNASFDSCASKAKNEGKIDHMKSISLVCSLVEFLDKWLREWKSNIGNAQSYVTEDAYNAVKEFCDKIPKLEIATTSYSCKEYSRALLYAEQYLMENRHEFQDHLPLLMKIYTKLEEKDAVDYILTIQHKEPDLEDLIHANELTGKLQEAVSCYERLSAEQDLKPELMKGMVNCYLNLDNPYSAMQIAKGMISKCCNVSNVLIGEQAEALWRLRRFDDLSHLLNNSAVDDTSWGSQIGKLLLDIKSMNQSNLEVHLATARDSLLKNLGTTNLETGAYRNNYQTIVRLQILNELESLQQLMHNILTDSKEYSIESLNGLLKKWDLKLKCTQKTSVSREPILCLRRITLELASSLLESRVTQAVSDIQPWIGKFWNESAKLARKAGHYNQAYNFVLKANNYNLKTAFIEKAKIYWEKGQQDLSLITLNRGIEENFGFVNTSVVDSNSALSKDDQLYCAKALLLIAKYNEENVNAEVNIKNYRKSVDMYKEYEKSFVCLGQYYDHVISSLSDDERDFKNSEYQFSAMYCFAKAMLFGCDHVYQSMSRLLSIWLDFSTRYAELQQSKSRTSSRDLISMRTQLEKMNTVIDKFSKMLPTYMFLTAFPQIASRICHPVNDVFLRVKHIIGKLIVTYPQQTMWMFISSCKSSYQHLARKSQEILQDQQVKQAKMSRFIQDFISLADQLIEFINTPVEDGVASTTVSSITRTLPQLFRTGISEIMIPTQKLRSIILPTSEESIKNHNPFPRSMVYIAGISEEVTILSSLQKPRKVSLRGSDGLFYPIMGKPKDDMRRDFRIMQFHGIINSYLQKDPESLQRRLQIRTYSVVPLNEECGILEWIPNLVGLRPIIIKMYREKKIYVPSREIKKMMSDLKDPLEKKRDMFLNQLLPKHPPVFAEWFYQTFPEPYRWYCARTSYIRTLAVMSMVGYIVGLGDRHGENILMDSTCGDAIHVDFNCLFNKGEAFDWPERVPFRLTHNMVDAMGPMGVEGLFRRTCEVTLQVIRSQRDTLISVLRPFVYDPMGSSSKGNRIESTNEQAIKHIQGIEQRVEGRMPSKKNNFVTYLSVKGQTNVLIQDAMNIDNLCQMYIGWGAYY